MAYLIQGEIYRSLADLDEVVFGEQAVYIDYVNRAKNAFKKANLIDKGSVEHSGPLREWQCDQQIEQSINESLSSTSELDEMSDDERYSFLSRSLQDSWESNAAFGSIPP